MRQKIGRHTLVSDQHGYKLLDIKDVIIGRVILVEDGFYSFTPETFEFSEYDLKSVVKIVTTLNNPLYECKLGVRELNTRQARQIDGMERAKLRRGGRGPYTGRVSKFSDADRANITHEFNAGGDRQSLADKWGISRAYLYQIAAKQK